MHRYRGREHKNGTEKMKTKTELIEEVLRFAVVIDPKSTLEEKAAAAKQGEGGRYTLIDLHNLIRDLKAQRDMAVEALEGVQFAVMRDGGSTLIPETLAKIKSGEWL